MIIGNGMLAKVFEPYKNNDEVLVFASGVSNSKEKDQSNFHKEALLLKDAINKNPEKLLIYFSTCSVYDNSVNKTFYVMHKIKMENLIKKKCSRFYIFRLPQVVGLTRSPTLVNYLFTSILNNKKIDINQHSTRNLISADDVLVVASYLVESKIYINEITNIATPSNMLVVDIIKIIEDITGSLLSYNLVNSGQIFDIDIEKIRNVNMDFNIFSPRYLENTLRVFFKNTFFLK